MSNKKNNLRKTYLISKRIFDIFLSLIALILFSPLFLIVWIIQVCNKSISSPIFKQKRVGYQGELFCIYKFQSMVDDAENVLKSNPELYDKYKKNNYKLEPHEDPRITPIGRFLRKTSLDELPQLINVLKGQMSLVGPRPVVIEELNEYGTKKEKFLSVKPGITGYWQASGRSSIGYPERVDIELYYVDNCSFFFDLKLIFMTAFQVLARKGAY